MLPRLALSGALFAMYKSLIKKKSTKNDTCPVQPQIMRAFLAGIQAIHATFRPLQKTTPC